MQINIPNKALVVIAAIVAAPVLFAAGQVSQIAKQPTAEDTRKQIVDTLQKQAQVSPPPVSTVPPATSSTQLQAQLQAQKVTQTTPTLAAVLREDTPTAAAVAPEPKLAGVNDVVALWVKSSEWSRTIALSEYQDSGMSAKPIMVVGVITNITPTHVTIGGRKWFNSRSYEDDKFYDIELIPRDIVYRVQVLGTAGAEFDKDVIVNSAPTGGFAPAPGETR